MVSVVWLFLIFGSTISFPNQAVDNFPTKEACELFRNQVKIYINAGLANPGAKLSPCMSREVVNGPSKR